MDDYKRSLKWNHKITDDKMLSLCEKNVDARAKCSDLSYTCALQEKLCIDFLKIGFTRLVRFLRVCKSSLVVTFPVI